MCISIHADDERYYCVYCYFLSPQHINWIRVIKSFIFNRMLIGTSPNKTLKNLRYMTYALKIGSGKEWIYVFYKVLLATVTILHSFLTSSQSLSFSLQYLSLFSLSVFADRGNVNGVGEQWTDLEPQALFILSLTRV